MKNIFKYELSALIKSIVIWTMAISVMIFIFLSSYTSMGADAEIMEKIIDNYPPELLKAFGINNALPISSVLGYLIFLFAFIQLLYAMQAANYGFSILSVEEREFTADYLMSKPISREGILQAKFFASVTALFTTAILSNLVLWGAIELFRGDNTYALKPLLMMMLSVYIFQMLFFSIGLVVSVLLRRIRNVLTFSLGLSFGTYILNTVRAVLDGEFLGFFSPFYYFDPAYILVNGAFNITTLFVSIVIIVLSLGTTYYMYPKRDIYSL